MPDPLRTLIVDDEQPARQLLAELLADEPAVDVIGECLNGYEAVQAIQDGAPDLVLLDVQMPKLDGFEVLELVDSLPAVIFVTAYDEYAVRAFEVHAVDYLLKPVDAERLHAAIERVAARQGGTPPARELAAEARGGGYLERILIRDGERIHVVPVDRIDLIEARDDGVVLRVGEARLRKNAPLGELEAELDPRRFLRVHRSFVLNLDRLARLELYAKDSRIAILKDGSKIPVSRAGYSRLREML